MGYEHVVFNAGLYAGMVFYNLDALSWLGVIKNIVFALMVTISVVVYLLV